MNKKIKTKFTARQIRCLTTDFPVELEQTPEGHYTRESLLKATRHIRKCLSQSDWSPFLPEDLDRAVPVQPGQNPFVFGGDGSNMEIISDCDDDLLNMFYEELKDEQPA